MNREMVKQKGSKNKVSAPGKVILSGEHAVVYGYPALVAAVDRRLTVNDKLEVKSEIPMGCGMGSSAAYAVAISAMNLKHSGKALDKGKIYESAYEIEKQFHGNPSGADPAISTYGGWLWYRKEAEAVKLFSRISVARKLPDLLLFNTGKPEETTKEMVVNVVGKAYRESQDKVTASLRGIEGVCKAWLRFLTGEEKADAGELIRENEKYLEEIGAVSESTKSWVRKIEKAGGSAKISGAGGVKGASGIILLYYPHMDQFERWSEQLGIDVFKVKLGEGGVRNER